MAQGIELPKNREGRNKGFGFIQFRDERSFEKTINLKEKFFGRPLVFVESNKGKCLRPGGRMIHKDASQKNEYRARSKEHRNLRDRRTRRTNISFEYVSQNKEHGATSSKERRRLRLLRKIDELLHPLLDDMTTPEIFVYLKDNLPLLKDLMDDKFISSETFEVLIKAIQSICGQSEDLPILHAIINSTIYNPAGTIDKYCNDCKKLGRLDDSQIGTFLNVLKLSNEILKRLPNQAHLRILFVIKGFEITFEKIEMQNTDVLGELDQLQQLHDTTIKKVLRQEARDEGTAENVDILLGSILPKVEDFRIKPLIDENLVYGCYKSTTHYLSTQFQLLREDFIRPIRSAVQQYLASFSDKKKITRLQDAFIYHDVRFIATDSFEKTRLQFHSRNLKRVRWQNCKRFIYGSLVCLSADRFESMIIATVMDRDPKELAEGYVDVKIISAVSSLPLNYKEKCYVLIEGQSYFEAYRHNLKRLQSLKRDFDAGVELPFRDYFVSPKNVTVAHPKYLLIRKLESTDSVTDEPLPDDIFSDINMHCLRSDDTEMRLKEFLDFSNWPSEENSCLDTSQLEALHHALTHEVAIIQGPPGTGKTYLGLKVVEFLFDNESVWETKEKKTSLGNPKRTKQFKDKIMVVCYTNHALDQFLSEILTLTRIRLKTVVRIGGRCKDKKLERITLKSHRRNPHYHRSHRSNGRDLLKINNGLSDVQAESKYLKSMLKNVYVFNITVGDLMQQAVAGHRQQFLVPRCSIQETIIYWVLGKDIMAVVKAKMDVQNDGEVIIEDIPDEDIPYDDIPDEDILYEDIQDEDILYAHIPDEDEPEEVMEVDERPAAESVLDEILPEPGEDEAIDVAEEAQLITDERFIYDDIHNEIYDDQNINNDISHYNKEFLLDKRALMNPLWPVKDLLKELNALGCRIQERKLLNVDYRSRRMNMNIWSMNMEERLLLYLSWYKAARSTWQTRLESLEITSLSLQDEKEKAYLETDQFILQSADIIAMTTTGASKFSHLIEAVCPKIVIVEESAEVLEAHIVTSLTVGCEHLILIGDHKQLRPKPTDFELARDYNLDISFFERLQKNGQPIKTLQLQHRMRPEISRLLVPHIYESLIDHDSVKDFDDIKGFETNMFFLNHSESEKAEIEGCSHSNDFEAEMVKAMSKYILMQGYRPDQITVLTPYVGQMFAIKNILPRREFEGIRITPIDNFQGEENDIIIFSFVRSNKMEKIGFLNTQNRICVALSRAKKGFYCLGNFKLYAKKCRVWRDIVTDLEEAGKIGSHLTLICQNHPNTKTRVTTPEDFEKCPFGGCQESCSTMTCGHKCPFKCHKGDHVGKYRCREKCLRSCEAAGHICKKLCFEECSPCPEDCTEEIECGHICQRKCGDVCTTRCAMPCSKSLPCSHQCKKLCYEPCECSEPCEKDLECGHRCDRHCSAPCTPRCTRPCLKSLPCSHQCQELCYEPCECSEPCEKDLECGHRCDRHCSAPCTLRCTRPCLKSLPCSHQCQELCYEPCECSEPCEKDLECGHRCDRHCSAPCTLRCTRPCLKSLPCSHQCQELCHEPCECFEPCEKDLECGHECRNRCSVPCTTRCRMPCSKTLLCGHQCTKLCYATCGKCLTFITVELECSHTLEKVCHKEATQADCETLMKTTLSCSHKMRVKCCQLLDKASIKCEKIVSKALPCDHQLWGKCGESNESIDCQVKVKYELQCGHNRYIECWRYTKYENQTNDLHGADLYCSVMCKRKLLCGHEILAECSQNSTNQSHCKRECEARCWHTRCRNNCNERCWVCRRPCGWECSHQRCSKTCFEVCDRKPCDEPCNQKTICGHDCMGYCGEPCPLICGKCGTAADPPSERDRYVSLYPCGHSFLRSVIDQHMKIKHRGGMKVVNVRCCPLSKCRKPILFCPRYSHVIKNYFHAKYFLHRNVLNGDWLCCKKCGYYMVSDLQDPRCDRCEGRSLRRKRPRSTQITHGEYASRYSGIRSSSRYAHRNSQKRFRRW
ncbi:NFX1-type zinc finger-containing protein 1-like isoform X2 [Tubulanus polymorphus]